MPTDQEYTLTELATLAGVTPRTVRYYVSVGLLPSPGQAGPATRYGGGHLLRVRLIRRLQAEHLPLAEIRARLEGLSDDEVEIALAETPAHAGDGSALDYIRALRVGGSPTMAARAAPMFRSNAPAALPAEPSPPERSQWERISLGSNVELHIRRPLSRLENKRVERLITIARELLEEDQP